MTFIVGWKTDRVSYLIADSAITKTDQDGSPLPPADVNTSFEELSICELGKRVTEGVLKIINLGQAAIAICGHYGVARSIAESFCTALKHDQDCRLAFQTAVDSNGPYSDPDQAVQLIVISPWPPSPRLFSFDSQAGQQIHELAVNELVRYGSMPDTIQDISSRMIGICKNIFHLEPQRYLVGALSILQSWGVHNNLLVHGVGGTFCGLMADENGIVWQPDILFILHSDANPAIDFVSSIVRDNVLVVRSSGASTCKYFGDSLNRGLDDNWKSKWWDPAFDFPAEGRFDYAVMLNTRSQIVTVVELLKHTSAAHFSIEAQTLGSGDIQIHISYSPDVTQKSTVPLRSPGPECLPIKFNWYPYQEPTGHRSALRTPGE